MPSFSKKQIKFIIRLAENIFTSNKTNTLEISGLRSNVDVINAGGAQFSCSVCQIFGVKQEDMNDVTTLMWTRNLVNQNTIEIYAIDDAGTYETLVFKGDIINAFGYYQTMPDVYLYIQAQGAYYNSLKPYPVTTFKGSADVATVIGQIAKSLGYNFENNNVTIKINNLYVANTGIEQIKSIAIAAGIDLYIDNNTIAICNPGFPRENFVAEINKNTGMIGYPTFDGLGVIVQTLFNPLVTYGGKIKVQSDIIRANGEWVASSISYSLSSVTPNGNFFTMIRGAKLGTAIYN